MDNGFSLKLADFIDWGILSQSECVLEVRTFMIHLLEARTFMIPHHVAYTNMKLPQICSVKI